MNYSAHYDRLISRARGRSLVGYCERHHVLPRCMGGGNEPENIVGLTAEEHFVGHQLLVKIYPDNRLLAHAVFVMAKRAPGHRAYGWLRRRHAEAKRGTKHTPETIAKISAALKGRTFTPEHRAQLSAAATGKTLTPETRAKISAAGLGKKLGPPSPGHRAKLSAALLGNTRWLGKTLTPEHRAKLSAALLGRKFTPEHRANISAAARRARHATGCHLWSQQ